MHIVKVICTAASILTGMAAQSYACEEEHSLRFKMPNLSDFYSVRVNGVTVARGNHSSGYIKLHKGLVPGKNEVSVLYETFKDGSQAEFSVHKGCKGGLPSDTSLATIRFKGEAEKAVTFRQTSVNSAVYPGAEPSDGTGLKEAVQRLQNATRNRDHKTIFSMHDPLLSAMRKDGLPMREINAHVRRVIKKGEIHIQDGLTMRPKLNKAIWEVRGPKGTPPVSIDLRSDKGQSTWSSGTLWVFANGEWAVLEP